MQEAAGEDTKLVRVMPNTPCLVGETASAMCLGGSASDEDAEEVRMLFSSVGRIVQVGTSIHVERKANVCLVFPILTNWALSGRYSLAQVTGVLSCSLVSFEVE